MFKKTVIHWQFVHGGIKNTNLFVYFERDCHELYPPVVLKNISLCVIQSVVDGDSGRLVLVVGWMM